FDAGEIGTSAGATGNTAHTNVPGAAHHYRTSEIITVRGAVITGGPKLLAVRIIFRRDDVGAIRPAGTGARHVEVSRCVNGKSARDVIAAARRIVKLGSPNHRTGGSVFGNDRTTGDASVAGRIHD